MRSWKTCTARRSAPISSRWSPRGRPTPAAPKQPGLTPATGLVERFSADLERVAATGGQLGLAVSSGPDSLALLLLAAAARPGLVEVASVDHSLRPGSAEEGNRVAAICRQLGVPHALLVARWDSRPQTAIQERARAERYRLLGQWGSERGLSAVATGHHLDDQAETLLMRLNRGAGVRGLAGMRPVAELPGHAGLALVRPLLGWRRSELKEVCARAGVEPVADPSNCDDRFERVRVRRAIDNAGWLDPQAIASSAGHLASADAALDWAAEREWDCRVTLSAHSIIYSPGAPAEIRRRVVGRAVAELASEGQGNPIRGRELDRLVAVLASGGKATLRGVMCAGGAEWRFTPAPARR